MKKPRLITMLVLGLFLFALPSFAVDANTQRYIQLLNEATASFKQGKTMQGVSFVQQACTLLHQDPAASSDDYAEVAAGCIHGIQQRIRGMHPGGNNLAGLASVSSVVSALQPLLQACIAWEPNNPRWHYESGMVYRLESASCTDFYPTFLMQAKQEFEKAASMQGGEYSQKAQVEIAECSQVINRRKSEMAAYQRAHPMSHNGPAYQSGHHSGDPMYGYDPVKREYGVIGHWW